MSPQSEPSPGAPCWVSLMTTELGPAEEFYARVLGWTFGPGTLGAGFSTAYRDGLPVAGLGAMAESLGLPVEWSPYFAVSDLDEAAGRVVERVGTVAVGPVSFGNGRAVAAADPHGARFGLWQGGLLPDWHTEHPRPPARLDLRTQDAFAAALFYGEVLDWTAEGSTCDTAYHAERVEVWSKGHIAATLFSGATEGASEPRFRPRWDVTFYVEDIDAATSAAREAGGSLVTSGEPPASAREVTLADPEGAHFTVRAFGEEDPGGENPDSTSV